MTNSAEEKDKLVRRILVSWRKNAISFREEIKHPNTSTKLYILQLFSVIQDDFSTYQIPNISNLFLIHRNYWRDSPFRPQCSSECKNGLLCDAKSGRSRDKLNLCPDLELKSDKVKDSPEISAESGRAGEEYDKNGQTLHRVHMIFTSIAVFRILIPFI